MESLPNSLIWRILKFIDLREWVELRLVNKFLCENVGEAKFEKVLIIQEFHHKILLLVKSLG